MPVHNAMPHLDAAIESILVQSFTNFEFVILDDGSSDGSSERLREWAGKDSRVRLFAEKWQLGPALSSEQVARAAAAPIVARMDADDISYPNRLREQFAVLSSRPDAGVVGSLCDTLDTQGRKIRGPEVWRLARMSWFVPFAHGAMMYRRSVFEQVGGYREECVFWEDQDLVTRMSAVSEVLVIPRSLYQVRQSVSSTRFTSDQQHLEQSLDLMYRSLARLEQDEGYDDLLDLRFDPPEKIDPRVYISLGSVVLWAGQRPRLFGRLLKRARLAPNLRSLAAVVWTGWASLSPGTLRPFLLLLLGLRNRYAAATIGTSEAVRWPQPNHARLMQRAVVDTAEVRSAPRA